jgi:hypothetical protein
LYDWRSAGRLSRILENGYLTGEAGEVMLLPGRRRMSFDKILLFGLGPKAAFDEARFASVTRAMVEALDDLCAAQVVIELPGRQADCIPPEVATDALLDIVSQSTAGRVWTLVEDDASRRRIEKHMLERRRRIRRIDEMVR